MHAVFATGGKQYRAANGSQLTVEKLPGEVGESVVFNDVMMISQDDKVNVGKPYIKGATVTAKVIEHGRGDKVKIIKFRRRKHSLKRQGHRQAYTKIEITDIKVA